MMRFITRDKWKKTGARLLAAVFWLLVWELIYRAVAQEILIISPVHAAKRLWELAGEEDFWLSVSGTCLRVLVGFFLALLTGGVLAALSSRFSVVHYLVDPFLGVVKSTPVASFIILTLIWLPTGRIPALIAFVMVVPIVWANIYAGIGSVDQQLLEMATLFRLSRWRKLRLIYIPAIMSYFVAACSTGLGAAWKSAIAAEVIAHPVRSVGTQIHYSRIYLNTPDLFAWTAAVVIFSVVLEKLAVYLLNKLQGRLLGAPLQVEGESYGD